MVTQPDLQYCFFFLYFSSKFKRHTALHSAMNRSNADVVYSLLSNATDPTVQNAYGETVLHHTASSPGRIEAIPEDGRCDVPS